MIDEKYYMQALEEYEAGRVDKPLWVKVIAIESGDEKAAKFHYIRERAKKISGEEGDASNQLKKAGNSMDSLPTTRGKVKNKKGKEIPEAGVWERCFARLLDTFFGASVIIFPAIYAFFIIYREYSGSTFLGLFLIISIMFLIFVFDGVVYMLFGNTLGKKMLGLRVVDASGVKLDAREYFSRNIDVWGYGFAFGIPFVHIACWIKEFYRVKNKMPASYDEESGFSVLGSGSSLWVKIVFVIVFVFLLMVLSIANEVIIYVSGI